jgi:hypothetical protein
VAPPNSSIDSTISWVEPWVMMVNASGLGDSAYTVDLGSSALPVTDLNAFREKWGWLKGMTQQD